MKPGCGEEPPIEAREGEDVPRVQVVQNWHNSDVSKGHILSIILGKPSF